METINILIGIIIVLIIIVIYQIYSPPSYVRPSLVDTSYVLVMLDGEPVRITRESFIDNLNDVKTKIQAIMSHQLIGQQRHQIHRHLAVLDKELQEFVASGDDKVFCSQFTDLLAKYPTLDIPIPSPYQMVPTQSGVPLYTALHTLYSNVLDYLRTIITLGNNNVCNANGSLDLTKINTVATNIKAIINDIELNSGHSLIGESTAPEGLYDRIDKRNQPTLPPQSTARMKLIHRDTPDDVKTYLSNVRLNSTKRKTKNSIKNPTSTLRSLTRS